MVPSCVLALDQVSSVFGPVEEVMLFVVAAINILTEITTLAITTLAITLYGEIAHIVNDSEWQLPPSTNCSDPGC